MDAGFQTKNSTLTMFYIKGLFNEDKNMFKAIVFLSQFICCVNLHREDYQLIRTHLQMFNTDLSSLMKC